MWKNNDGFTLLEMLISLYIVCCMMLLTLVSYHEINLDHYEFLNDYLSSQSLALKNREDEYCDYGLHFNSLGHVNLAKTIDFHNHKVIVHLGNGYVNYE